MKKLFFIAVGLFVSLSLANANDLLFKASNGVLNENSVGVKKLNDEELAQVKGGLMIQTYKETGYRNLYGQAIYTIYWQLSLEEYESRNATIYLNNGADAYHNYTTFMTYARAGTPVIQVKYNMDIDGFQVDFAVMTPTNQLYYSNDQFAKFLVNLIISEKMVLNWTREYSYTRASRFLR